MADEDIDLVRYWFDFDVSGLGPEPAAPGTISLDGGTVAYRLCHRGLGVTGYDADDGLALVQALLGDEPLPPVVRVTRDVDVDSLGLDLKLAGVAAWRGVWYPPANLRGPVIGPASA